MKIELADLEHSEALSQETAAFTAVLVVDGVRVGTVANAGHGGANVFRGDRAAHDAADRWCNRNLPAIDLGHGRLVNMDLETHVLGLVEAAARMRDLRAQLAETVVWHDPADGHLYAMTIRTDAATAIAAVAAEHPTAIILNRLPFDEALVLYAKAAEG